MAYDECNIHAIPVEICCIVSHDAIHCKGGYGNGNDLEILISFEVMRLK